jgi:hypothetical protein
MREPVIESDMELIGYYDEKNMNPADIFLSYFVTNYQSAGETDINTDDNSIIEFSTARFRGKIVNHIERLVKEPMKILPVKLAKEDFDIEFETDLPYYGSKYLLIQMGIASIVTKQIVFKDDFNTLFLQTQIQSEPPTLSQAQQLAANFNAVITNSENNLYSFASETSGGLIGYCPDLQQSYVAYSTNKDPIIIRCKKKTSE